MMELTEKQILEKEWVTKAGLTAKVVIQPAGHRCGYVKVPSDIPYTKDDLDSLEVHGGVTYEHTLSDCSWVGFDCAHYGDAPDPAFKNPSGFRRFYEYGVVRSLEFCINECESMAEQITKNKETKMKTLNSMIGSRVIVRTYSAGCWFGVLEQKKRNEVILKDARRMYRWKAAQGISLSACALYGITHDKSKIVEPVPSVWLEAIEIIPCSEAAIKSLGTAPHVAAE